MTPEQLKSIKMTAGILLGSSVIIGLAVYAVRKKKKKQEKEASAFIVKLEQAIEPEKIDRALLSEAFSPAYWKSVKNQQNLISKEAALELAKQIYEAWNSGTFWDDDEEEVYRAFEDSRLKSFADVSKVADQYRSEKVAGLDLWKHLNSKLSKTEIAKVKQIVIDKK